MSDDAEAAWRNVGEVIYSFTDDVVGTGPTDYDGFLACMADRDWRLDPVTSRAGTLSLAALNRMFDEWWNEPHPGTYLDASSPARDHEYGYASSRADREPTHCRAVLFPLPTDMWEPALWYGQVVDPCIARRIGPMHGPRPAECARGYHPDSPYHWDGRGTWWK